MQGNSFGTRLQEKNYLYFRIRLLQENSLWQQMDRITKYLARFLWIRRFVRIFLFMFQLIEQSIVIVVVTTITIFLLPLWLFAMLLDWICNRFRYRAADLVILSQNTKLFFWSSSATLPLSTDSVYFKTLCQFQEDGFTVISILSQKKRQLFQAHLTQLSQGIFSASPSYFFHLRKKLNDRQKANSIFIYE